MKSCIVSEFRSYIDLTDQECELVQSLERDPREFRKDEIITAEGDPAKTIFTISSGWVASCRHLANGNRQILDVYLPGQIVGMRKIGFEQSMNSIVAIGPVVACPYPKRNLIKTFDDSPRLTEVVMLMLAQQQSLLVERIMSLGQRSADCSLAHFVLELRARLKTSDLNLKTPLTQELIADTLGVTSVHISRTLTDLTQKSLLEWSAGTFKILNLDALVELAGFDSSYLEPDVNWIRDP